MDGFDEKGRPRRVPGKVPTAEGSYITPTFRGATNWAPPSYSPRTGLFYVPAWENTAMVAIEGQAPRIPGVSGTGSLPQGQVSLTPNTKKEDEGFGVIRALDPRTLEPKWDFKMNDITWAGVLTTASDLAFGGGKEGYFVALDARTGALALEGGIGWPDQQRPDELCREWQTVRDGRGRKRALHLRTPLNMRSRKRQLTGWLIVMVVCTAAVFDGQSATLVGLVSFSSTMGPPMSRRAAVCSRTSARTAMVPTATRWPASISRGDSSAGS